MHINTNNVTKFNNKTQCKNMLTEGITIITITHKSVLPTTRYWSGKKFSQYETHYVQNVCKC